MQLQKLASGSHVVADCVHLSKHERGAVLQAGVFTAAGVKKIRLTGGEPTLRSDLVQLTQRLHALPESPAIGITTNAVALKRRLAELQASGMLTACRLCTISTDSQGG